MPRPVRHHAFCGRAECGRNPSVHFLRRLVANCRAVWMASLKAASNSCCETVMVRLDAFFFLVKYCRNVCRMARSVIRTERIMVSLTVGNCWCRSVWNAEVCLFIIFILPAWTMHNYVPINYTHSWRRLLYISEEKDKKKKKIIELAEFVVDYTSQWQSAFANPL